MNKEVMKLTVEEITKDKKQLAKTSMKIGGIVLAGKVIKDIGNTTYNGVKKNSKKANENRKRIRSNKKKIKRNKELLKGVKKNTKFSKEINKNIKSLEEKNKYARKNVLKHSSLAVGEALALPVVLGTTGVIGFKMFEIERNVIRETTDEVESIYRGIEYNMEDETW